MEDSSVIYTEHCAISLVGGKRGKLIEPVSAAGWLMQHIEIWGAFMHNKPLLSGHLSSSECLCMFTVLCVDPRARARSCVFACVYLPLIYIGNRCLLCYSLPQHSLRPIFITSSMELHASFVDHSYHRAVFFFFLLSFFLFPDIRGKEGVESHESLHLVKVM